MFTGAFPEVSHGCLTSRAVLHALLPGILGTLVLALFQDQSYVYQLEDLRHCIFWNPNILVTQTWEFGS